MGISMRRWFFSFLLATILPSANGAASDYGTTGLIKIPNAFMEDDGVLRASVAVDEVANVYNITFQALPRVQATFRYSIFNPTNLPGSLDKMRDRSYGVKAQILKESTSFPAVALGGRDVLGTGVWEGEYLAASKTWGRFEATLGLGWGRLGSRSGFSNPLGVLSDSFDQRPGQSGGELGGKARGDSFFRGDSALFGGISYRLASYPLTLMAEYDSDIYEREVRFRTFRKSPPAWNLGFNWEPWKNVNIRLSWLRGDAVGLGFSTQVGAKDLLPRRKSRRAAPEGMDAKTGLPEGYDPTSWYDRMLFASEQSGLLLREGKINADQTKASLIIENVDYNLAADAVNEVALLSANLLPATVNGVDLLLEEGGLKGPTISYTLLNGGDIRSAQGDKDILSSLQILAPRELLNPTNTTDYGYPSVGFGLDLGARVQLMDPDDPARKQIYAKLTTRLQLSNHTNVWLRYEQDLYNDFSLKRGANSRLPNVRTQVNRYLVDGESGVEQLYVEHKRSLGASLYMRAYAGILESMYGGVGAEVLYSPFMKRWAVGFNVNAVKQRAYERNLEFFDYETITSHLSVYYASPFYQIDTAVHFGRYLAKDLGYTFEARRTFDSGFALGGFFTRTNVSAEEFGEGSFDKGLFFRIPFDGFLPGNTRSHFRTVLRPLERDGGRRLENFGGDLWFERRSLRFDALDRNRERMLLNGS